MYIKAASRSALIAASGAVALTAGIAAAQSDRDTARRHCIAMARIGTPPSRPSIATKKRQAAAYNECMDQAGFGRGHANTK
jgi:hypothetical protein